MTVRLVTDCPPYTSAAKLEAPSVEMATGVGGAQVRQRGTAAPLSLGRYAGCRQSDGFGIGLTVIDDNASVECDVKSKPDGLLPSLERAMRPACEAFIDRLAHSRPVGYGGNASWTVR